MIVVAKPKILVVDDCIPVRAAILRMLGDSYETAEAGDGEDGLVQVKAFCPHVILLDVGMPVMDGLAMLRRLRDAGDTTPVILITGGISVAAYKKLLADGAVFGHVPKPIPADELRRTITDALCARHG